MGAEKGSDGGSWKLYEWGRVLQKSGELVNASPAEVAGELMKKSNEEAYSNSYLKRLVNQIQSKKDLIQEWTTANSFKIHEEGVL